jgi:hypothetical protein
MPTPKLSATKTTAAKPTRAEFEEYCETRERRLELNREAATLERREKAIAEKIQAYAIAAGGKNRTVISCGHRASVLSKPGSVSWLDQFTALRGVDEVNRLKSEAPPRDYLEVAKV